MSVFRGVMDRLEEDLRLSAPHTPLGGGRVAPGWTQVAPLRGAAYTVLWADLIVRMYRRSRS